MVEFAHHFVQTLAQLCQQQNFRLLGWVLIPEHFHLLLWPFDESNSCRIVQSLKERPAKFALSHLRRNTSHRRCVRMLKEFSPPGTARRPFTHLVWKRRFYDLNVWSEKKRLEKLDYMHNNPVKGGLVNSADPLPWSSFRFYYV